MEHKDEFERIKAEFRPFLELAESFWGKEVYDNHIIDVLEYFGYSTEDEIVIEIFGKLERK